MNPGLRTALPLQYPARQFAVFRIAFGVFLFVWLARLVPYAAQLFSRDGIFPTWPDTALPNLLRSFDSPRFATAYLAFLTAVAALYALGAFRRSAALVLWYGLASLVARTSGIANPSLAYLGWLLLASALVPAGEPWALRRRPADPAWRMPPLLFYGAWAIMAVAYTASGWDKLGSLGWRNGTAVPLVLGLPFARDTVLRDAILALPDPLLHLLTWAALGTELLFAPACLWRPTRIAFWCAGVGLHLGLLALLDFADISVAMLAIHLWTFDVRWLPGRMARPPARLA